MGRGSVQKKLNFTIKKKFKINRVDVQNVLIFSKSKKVLGIGIPWFQYNHVELKTFWPGLPSLYLITTNYNSRSEITGIETPQHSKPREAAL